MPSNVYCSIQLVFLSRKMTFDRLILKLSHTTSARVSSGTMNAIRTAAYQKNPNLKTRLEYVVNKIDEEHDERDILAVASYD